MTKTLKQVQEARAEGIKAIFNKEAVLAAISNTPAKVSNAGTSGLTGDIKQIFEAVGKGTPLALNQVRAAYLAATGTDLPAKKFADYCWTMSDKNKNNKAPLLKAGAEKGTYELA